MLREAKRKYRVLYYKVYYKGSYIRTYIINHGSHSKDKKMFAPIFAYAIYIYMLTRFYNRKFTVYVYVLSPRSYGNYLFSVRVRDEQLLMVSDSSVIMSYENITRLFIRYARHIEISDVTFVYVINTGVQHCHPNGNTIILNQHYFAV